MANPINWQREMEKTLASLPEGTRPKLLLHACCGPCSSAVLEQLYRRFDITILYYNPNIWPEAEYRRRADELAAFVARFAPEGEVKLKEDRYIPNEFYSVAKELENEPERGARCTRCYALRLERAAEYAAENGFDYVCTTLSISPHKDAVRLNQLGMAAAERHGVHWLPGDFKKKEGYKRSLQLSEEYGLYRQDYCGCEFSARK